MTKKNFLKHLISELKRLERIEHLADLVIHERYDEAQAVIDEIDYSILNKYFDNNEKDHWLKVSDIPKKYHVIFAFYICGSKQYSELDLMESWEELQVALIKQGNEGAIIAKKMDHNCLNFFQTIADLMASDEEEDAVD